MAKNIKIALDGNDTPYLAYNTNSILIAQKFNGTQWEELADVDSSIVFGDLGNLVVDNLGVPYVVYNNGNAIVRKFNGSIWESVGDTSFSGFISASAMAVTSTGVPYVAHNNLGGATVQKFNGSSWELVGNIGFSQTALSSVTDIKIALNTLGSPYVLYRVSNTNKITVKKYDGTSWESVGNENFSAGATGYPNIEVDNANIPFVAYMDVFNSNKLTVQKFNGSIWEYVGIPGFTVGNALEPSLSLDDEGVPYVVYKDGANQNKISVQKFNGTDWEIVGVAGFSQGVASNPSIVVKDLQTIYVVYRDGAKQNKVTVQKFNGSNWEVVGAAGFSTNQSYDPSITIDAFNKPYIVFGDGSNFNKATVQRFNGINWEQVGQQNFSSGSSQSFNLNFDNQGNLFVSYTNVGAFVKKFATGTSPNTSSPIIISTDEISIEENQTFVVDVNATDENNSEGNGLSFTLAGGADQSLFVIEQNTGILTFLNPPDFENPSDSDVNNNYLVEIRVTNSAGLSTVQNISITVTDVLEQRPFITTWQVTVPTGVIVVPTFPNINYDYTIDWGDGTIESGLTGDATHIYAVSGTYTVSINGEFPRIYFGNDNFPFNKYLIKTIEQWGDINWSSMESAFQGCANLNVVAVDSPKLENVSSMKSMFRLCSSLTGNNMFNDWNVSSITTMESMFNGAELFNQNISSWNVGQVTNMSEMYFGADSFNQPLGNWNVSSVMSMSSMFNGASAFNQDLSSWDVALVNTMSYMFGSAVSFNQPLGVWNVGNVDNMQSMFQGATAFNQPLENWDVGNVRNMNLMFSEAISFDQNLGNWNISSLQSEFGFDPFGQPDGPDLASAAGMFQNAGLSSENYDALLLGWGTLNEDAGETQIPIGITLDAGSTQFCDSETIKEELQNTYGWTIEDAGKDPNCVADTEAPTIVCSDDIIYFASEGEDIIPIQIIFPTATDNVSNPENIMIKAERSDGAPITNEDFQAFMIYDVIITWTAEDEAGNISEPCEQLVSIAFKESGGVLDENGSLSVGDADTTSDKNYTLSIVGENLILSSTTGLQIFGEGVVQLDSKTVQIPMSSITQGLSIDGGEANNTLLLDTSLALLGENNGLTLSNINVQLTGSGDLQLNALNVTAGNFDTNGLTTIVTTAATFFGDATLSGSGAIAGTVIMNADALLAPGTSPGILATGDLILNSDSILEIEVIGPIPGTEHDQISVTGTVTLNNATLNLLGGYANDSTDEIIIIANNGTDLVTGIFAGLEEGASITFGAFNGALSYTGGDGNDVVLLGMADTESPVISCPTPITISSENNCSATVSLSNPTATDNFSTIFTFQGIRSDGAQLTDPFFTGQTIITWTAIDEAGNVSESCEQIVTITSAAGCWEKVGGDLISDGDADNLDFARALNGDLYVTYRDFTINGVTVKRFANNQWQDVGGPVYESTGFLQPSLAVNSGNVPFVSYFDNDLFRHIVKRFENGSWQDFSVIIEGSGLEFGNGIIAFNPSNELHILYQAQTGRLTLKKWTGALWQTVGSALFSNPTVDYRLTFDTLGNPYVSYQESEDIQQLSVQRFVNGSWEFVGPQRFSQGVGAYHNLAIGPNNTAYVGYYDSAGTNVVRVQKFENGTWEDVGTSPFAGYVESISLTFDQGDTPYIGFKANGDYRTVKRFQNGDWVSVGGETPILNPNIPDFFENMVIRMDNTNPANPVLYAAMAKDGIFVKQIQLELLDTQPPTITCPEDLVEVLSTGTTASITLTDPEATDNSSTNFTFEGIRSDGLPLSDPFPVGETTITWTATDQAGNTSESCAQTISVMIAESEVTLNEDGSLSIMDTNGGVSDDNFVISINNGNLRFSSSMPVAISGEGVVQVDENTIDIPLSSLTNGITIDGQGGANTLLLDTSLALLGENNGLTVSNINVQLTGSGNLQLNALNVTAGNFDTNGLTTIVITTATFFGDASLSGIGSILGTVIMNADALLAPGVSPGILSTGDLVLNSDSILEIEVNGPTPGTEHDQITVTGTVTLNNATLNLVGGYANDSTDEIIIIANDGTDPVTGTFADLEEGAAITFGAFNGVLSYTGGDGNDVVLSGTVPVGTPRPFVTTWKTDNPGTSNSTSITIPTTGIGYNYDVDWDNDGIYDEFGITGNVTHDFGIAGTYTIRVKGDFPRIIFNNSGDKEKLLFVEQWGDVKWSTFQSAFSGCSNLDLKTIDVPDLTGVNNLSSMFSGCAALTDINGSLSNWNVSSVTRMHSMFLNAISFNQYIGNWDVSSVTNMASMFNTATAFDKYIGNWNVSRVTDMRFMFSFSKSFNQDISSWDVSKVNNMMLMFRGAASFNQDIGNWDVRSVTDMLSMFEIATSFDQSLGNWNISNLTTGSSMFAGAGLSTENYDDTLIGWSILDTAVGETKIPQNITFDGGNSQYCSGEIARQNLIDNFGWTITDGGLFCEDTEAPIAQCQDISVALDTNGTVTITAAEINNGSTDNVGISMLSVFPDTFSCADLGANTVTLTVEDSNGNTSSCTATVVVQDVTPPVLTCPANISVSSSNGNPVVLENLEAALAVDNCPGDLTLIGTRNDNLPLNEPFPVGTTLTRKIHIQD